MNQVTLFCDLDGVVADLLSKYKELFPDFIATDLNNFDKKTTTIWWNRIEEYSKGGGRLWEALDWTPGGQELWNYIKKYNPQILTATGKPVYKAAEQKRIWVNNHLGEHVVVNFSTKATEKALLATPGAILIDDRLKAIEPWRLAGGIGIHYTTTELAIQELQKMGM